MTEFWKNRRVLVTGHTGFKGAWLTLWLRSMDAKVCGISLEPEQTPGLLDQFSLVGEVDHHIQDIRDLIGLTRIFKAIEPEVVIHLAAQPIVRRSYSEPVDTWTTNVLGTINVLESLKSLRNPVAAVLATTDKVYRNNEWAFAYRENDPLGGHDPYSSSKAAAEFAVNSWRSSFFKDGTKVAVATARAGNVVGGGDFAPDRIVPDIVRSLALGQPVEVRNPNATRPWQHVLEPLSGYLTLAQQLFESQRSRDVERLDVLCSSWNFGPLPEGNRTVKELVELALREWPGSWVNRSDGSEVHEAMFLGLAIEKATRYLNWYPRWSFEQTIQSTISWYKQFCDSSPRQISLNQICEYVACGHRKALTEVTEL